MKTGDFGINSIIDEICMQLQVIKNGYLKINK